MNKLLRNALIAVLLVLLGCNVYLLGARAAGVPNPAVFGCRWAVVMSGSMAPALNVDDMVVFMHRADYEVGDIITFQNGGVLTTHRIVEETAEGFVTQGDANNTPDTNLVVPEQILGAVLFTVPGVGTAIGYIKSPAGLMMLALLGAVLLTLQALSRAMEDEKSGGKEP